MKIHLTVALNWTFLLLCAPVCKIIFNEQQEELAACSPMQLETFTGDDWVNLFLCEQGY